MGSNGDAECDCTLWLQIRLSRSGAEFAMLLLGLTGADNGALM
jgi:hypothetical protein